MTSGPARGLFAGLYYLLPNLSRFSQITAAAHGHPALANPYAVYFNPAALGGVQGTQVVVDGTLVFRTVDFDREA